MNEFKASLGIVAKIALAAPMPLSDANLASHERARIPSPFFVQLSLSLALPFFHSVTILIGRKMAASPRTLRKVASTAISPSTGFSPFLIKSRHPHSHSPPPALRRGLPLMRTAQPQESLYGCRRVYDVVNVV